MFDAESHSEQEDSCVMSLERLQGTTIPRACLVRSGGVFIDQRGPRREELLIERPDTDDLALQPSGALPFRSYAKRLKDTAESMIYKHQQFLQWPALMRAIT